MVRALVPPPGRRPTTGRLAAALLLACCLAGIALAPPAAAQTQAASTYTNPVSRDFADTFADPAVIKAKDGWWYAYGTTDPLREGEGTRHIIPTARSADLVNWTYVGDAFTETTKPSWATPDAALWARPTSATWTASTTSTTSSPRRP
jgi:arabinan endo-1,5-alpha-L-arabinosidase